MINIKTFNQGSDSRLYKDINKNDSILIIGKGSNSYKLNDFTKPNGYLEMNSLYGDSELTIAYLEAVESGAKNIYVMNCYKTTDFIDCLDFIKHFNFAYIVPIGINVSDKFYSIKYNKQMYYAEYYLMEFSKYTNSLIVFTDNHGSLYENINDYLRDMTNKIMVFKQEVNYLLDLYGRNLAFILNTLNEAKYSNIVLASMLSKTAPGQYPSEIYYTACYDMHQTDIIENEMIYFQNNFNIKTSLENLNNFRTIYDINKLINIDLIIKHIEKNLDLSFIVGKLYTSFLRMDLHDYIDVFFRKELNYTLKKYVIQNINFIPKEDMTGYIEINIELWPINALDSINIALEVG